MASNFTFLHCFTVFVLYRDLFVAVVIRMSDQMQICLDLFAKALQRSNFVRTNILHFVRLSIF